MDLLTEVNQLHKLELECARLGMLILERKFDTDTDTYRYKLRHGIHTISMPFTREVLQDDTALRYIAETCLRAAR